MNKNTKVFGLVFIILFAIVYFLMQDTGLQKAQKEIVVANNIEDVKMVWFKYKLDFGTDDDFKESIKIKLNELKYSPSAYLDIIKWFPVPKALNIVVVPDLSQRLRDDAKQKQTDSVILNAIWQYYEKLSVLGKHTKDRLTIDFAQPTDTNKNLDELIFDTSEGEKKQSNRLYFDNHTLSNFTSKINEIYKYALTSEVYGARYNEFLNTGISNYNQKSNLDFDYQNILIMVTDGYLDFGKEQYTGTNSERNAIDNAINNGYDAESAILSKLKLPRIENDIELKNWKVLMVEVNPNRAKSDRQILKKYWGRYLTNLGCSNIDNFMIYKNPNHTKTSLRNLDEWLKQ